MVHWVEFGTESEILVQVTGKWAEAVGKSGHQEGHDTTSAGIWPRNSMCYRSRHRRVDINMFFCVKDLSWIIQPDSCHWYSNAKLKFTPFSPTPSLLVKSE